jgi:hypothetical protein
MEEYSSEIEDNDFAPQIKDLITIRFRLRYFGSLILFFLIGCIILLGVFVFLRKRMFLYDQNQYTHFDIFRYDLAWEIIGFELIFIVAGVILLFAFNQQKNRGLIIYEELTEEIDWSSKRKEFLHRPPIKTRIIIKEFLKSTDLPFTSGKSGSTFYLGLFIMVSIATIIVAAL